MVFSWERRGVLRNAVVLIWATGDAGGQNFHRLLSRIPSEWCRLQRASFGPFLHFALEQGREGCVVVRRRVSVGIRRLRRPRKNTNLVVSEVGRSLIGRPSWRRVLLARPFGQDPGSSCTYVTTNSRTFYDDLDPYDVRHAKVSLASALPIC